VGPVWMGAENIALTGTLSPDLPPRSESLYRNAIPAHVVTVMAMEIRAYSLLSPHLTATGTFYRLRQHEVAYKGVNVQ
jgi:hypothetical protein